MGRHQSVLDALRGRQSGGSDGTRARLSTRHYSHQFASRLQSLRAAAAQDAFQVKSARRESLVGVVAIGANAVASTSNRFHVEYHSKPHE